MDALYQTYSNITLDNQHGRFGTIYCGTRTSDNMPVVIKQVRKTRELLYYTDGETPMEIGMLIHLKDTPGVCQLLEWFNYDDEYIFVMKRELDSVDLFDFITINGDKLSEEMAMIIIKNIFMAVLELDAKNVVHRDLKPDNILIDKQTLKVTLIDFGGSTFKRPNNASFKSFYGTIVYYPPEFYTNREYTSEALTVWSLGVILYEMVVGHLPFETAVHVVSRNLEYRGLSERMVRILQCMLFKDSEIRYTFSDLKLELLSSPLDVAPYVIGV